MPNILVHWHSVSALYYCKPCFLIGYSTYTEFESIIKLSIIINQVLKKFGHQYQGRILGEGSDGSIKSLITLLTLFKKFQIVIFNDHCWSKPRKNPFKSHMKK